MNTQVLTKLKELSKKRGDTSAFANHDEFLPWSDEVIPLLEFDKKLQDRFVFWSNHVKSANARRHDTHHEALGECIGLVNQAISKLQMQKNETYFKVSTPKKTELDLPEKITLNWLYQHASWKFWVGLFFTGGTIFTAGVMSSKLTVIQQIYGL
jgi:hypothetical protein